MTVDDVREQLANLKTSVDKLSDSMLLVTSDVKSIREEQQRSIESHKKLHQETRKLHDEHQSLVVRLGEHESHLTVHIRDYERQQETNALIHAHMAGETSMVRSELKEFRGEFRDHARTEEEDRKDALAAQYQTNDALRSTVRTVIIAGGGLFLTLLGLLVTMWTYADNLSQALSAIKGGVGL